MTLIYAFGMKFLSFGPDIHEALAAPVSFSMIDRVLECSDRHAVALKNVTMNAPYLSGLFRENPIASGVMLSESVLKTCAFIGQHAAYRKPWPEWRNCPGQSK